MMKIGILSDTHNNLYNLRAALDIFAREGIETLIHCGDMTEAKTALAMQGFRVIAAFGNGDVASGEIRQALLELNPDNFAGLVFSGKIGDSMIAVTHGHIAGKVEELVESGEYDFVFKGHSHRHQDSPFGDTRLARLTRLINPGSLGGLKPEPRSVCVLDLTTGEARFVQLPGRPATSRPPLST